MTDRLRIVVTGQIVQYPLGGVTWFYLQYAAGLARLGHDVFYIEDTGQWPYSIAEQGLVDNSAPNLEYAAAVFERFDLGERWAYRSPGEGKWFGMTDELRERVVKSADLLINVSGTLEQPHTYRDVKRLVYVDTDPVFTQVKIARGQRDFERMIALHDVHFSYGESPDHRMPETAFIWQPTRTPVLLAEWHAEVRYRDVFTTVMNWTSHNSVEHNGQRYGQKDVEFRRFIDLPALVPSATLELAIGPGHGSRTPYDLLRHKGWHTVDPDVVCPDLDRFRSYTETSKAEWGVAKGGYVLGQSGWFSERSARYLASGRPVVVQDTGFSTVLPSGVGIVPFRSIEDAVAGIEDVQAHYDRHANAAREIAAEYFDSDRVLARLVERAIADDVV